MISDIVVKSMSPLLRFSRVFGPILLCALLAGCGGSILSGTGPSIHAINSDAAEAKYTVIDLSADTIVPYLRQADVAPTHAVAATEIPSVKLVPGDVIRVMIADSSSQGAIFAPLASGGTVFSNVRLNSKGQISLPYVGHKKISGATLTEVEDILRKSLKGVATDPQVYVELVGDLSGSVLVAGAVKAPGRFSALQGPLTLLDAINKAGGPTTEPYLTTVTLRTGSRVQTFNYERLLNGGNRIVPPNSEIVLERARKRFVAMGAVTQPGLHDLPSSNPSLLDVLGVAGGLNDRAADASGVFVFRLNETGKNENGSAKAEVFRLDMKNPEAIFLARMFLVQPEDAVYVTNAAVYEWQKIISPIVQVLILGRTINTGF